MSKQKVENQGLRSGWCGFDMRDTRQHEGCKEVFKSPGFPEWTCACECHGESVTKPVKDRAEATKGK